MVAIHTPIDKTTVYTPVTKTCRVATRRGMLSRGYVWEGINTISSLYPEGYFRTEALAAAKKFVADMERQGFKLITPEANMLVYGPVRHRDFNTSTSWTPAPGAASTFKATGFAHSEESQSDSEDFLLRAEFLATRVHMAEYVKRETTA